jgi:two-component system NtrC family response regulator
MFRPIGSPRELKSDFRLIAATNRNLDEMTRDGRFREDLLFRLKSLVIDLPPLRERTGDIMEIALYHTKKMAEREVGMTKGMSPEFIEALTLYHWPGNVRELLSAMERAFENSREEPILHTQHLPAHIRIHAARTVLRKRDNSQEGSPIAPYPESTLPPLKEFRESRIADLETRYLRELMRRTNGDMRTASEISGLSRSRLYSLLQQHRIVFAR